MCSVVMLWNVIMTVCMHNIRISSLQPIIICNLPRLLPPVCAAFMDRLGFIDNYA